jgi:hypothetical protein
MLLKHNFLLFYIFLKSKTKWGSGFGHFPLYIYGPTFGNAEISLFLFAARCFNTESMQKGYPNYRWDLIRYIKG